MRPQARKGLPGLAALVAVQTGVSASSLVVEIVAGRMLAPYIGMSLYSWTAIIAVVLAGFSAGHWAGGAIADRPPRRALALTAWSLVAAALATAGCIFLLRWLAPAILPAIDSTLAGITVLTAAIFFMPSFFAGIPAPVLARIAVEGSREREGRALGAVFAAGAVGAIAGTLLAGFVFISWIGSIGTLSMVAAVYLALALVCAACAGRILPGLAAALPAAVLAGAGLLQPASCTRESAYFCIRVIDAEAEAGEPARLMVLDHLGHGMSARHSPRRMLTPHAALLDALTRSRVGGRQFSAFLIGGGSYSLPRAWSTLEPPPRLTVAEIDPAVTQTAVADFWFDPEVATVHHGDARRILLDTRDRFDVVIGDAFTDITIPAHLVTREFFELVAARLQPDGAYLMNVVDHPARLQALAAIAATMRTVFPVVEIWVERASLRSGGRTVFILLGSREASATAAVLGAPPDRLEAERMPAELVDGLIASRKPPVLTDDYAPIDRLTGISG